MKQRMSRVKAVDGRVVLRPDQLPTGMTPREARELASELLAAAHDAGYQGPPMQWSASDMEVERARQACRDFLSGVQFSESYNR